jgi:hypothetical protein
MMEKSILAWYQHINQSSDQLKLISYLHISSGVVHERDFSFVFRFSVTRFIANAFYFPKNPFFFVSVLGGAALPLGTFLKRRFGAPHGGQDQLSGSSAHALGPFVKT